jgi:hypothetical protein
MEGPWHLTTKSWEKRSGGYQHMKRKCGLWYIVSRLGAIT